MRTPKNLKSVQVCIEIGHRAWCRDEETKTPEKTHDWVLFVRGKNNKDNLEHFIEKVVFHLHQSFSNPTRVINQAPFRISESGYGSFIAFIEVYFKMSDKVANTSHQTYQHDITLPAIGNPPLELALTEKITFTSVAEEFAEKVLKGGGTLVDENLVTKHKIAHKGKKLKESDNITSPNAKDSSKHGKHLENYKRHLEAGNYNDDYQIKKVKINAEEKLTTNSFVDNEIKQKDDREFKDYKKESKSNKKSKEHFKLNKKEINLGDNKISSSSKGKQISMKSVNALNNQHIIDDDGLSSACLSQISSPHNSDDPKSNVSNHEMISSNNLHSLFQEYKSFDDDKDCNLNNGTNYDNASIFSEDNSIYSSTPSSPDININHKRKISELSSQKQKSKNVNEVEDDSDQEDSLYNYSVKPVQQNVDLKHSKPVGEVRPRISGKEVLIKQAFESNKAKNDPVDKIRNYTNSIDKKILESHLFPKKEKKSSSPGSKKTSPTVNNEKLQKSSSLHGGIKTNEDNNFKQNYLNLIPSLEALSDKQSSQHKKNQSFLPKSEINYSQSGSKKLPPQAEVLPIKSTLDKCSQKLKEFTQQQNNNLSTQINSLKTLHKDEDISIEQNYIYSESEESLIGQDEIKEEIIRPDSSLSEYSSAGVEATKDELDSVHIQTIEKLKDNNDIITHEDYSESEGHQDNVIYKPKNVSIVRKACNNLSTEELIEIQTKIQSLKFETDPYILYKIFTIFEVSGKSIENNGYDIDLRLLDIDAINEIKYFLEM